MASELASQLEEILNNTQLLNNKAFEKVNESVQLAMINLFTALDKNNDGCIQFEEFQGMTLASWAASRAVFMAMTPGMDALDYMKTVIQDHLPHLTDRMGFDTVQKGFFSIGTYISLLIFIHLTLAAIEYIRAILKLPRYGWDFPKEIKPREDKVPISTAMKYDTPLSGWYEWTKVIVCTISGFAPLRIGIGFIFFILGCIALNISTLIPYQLWHDCWRAISRRMVFMQLFCIGYYKIDVYGENGSERDVKLLLGNHSAVVEVFVLFILSFPSFVSRIENLSVPLFGGVCHCVDAVLVDRSEKSSKQKTADAILQRTQDIDAPQLMLFPEGTCGNNLCVFRFNRGAFASGKPVQLVAFKYAYTHYNPAWTGNASGGHELWQCIYRSSCQLVNRVQLRYLPIHYPTEEEKKNPTVYANNMQKLMAGALDLPITDASFKNYQELEKKYQEKKRVARRLRCKKFSLRESFTPATTTTTTTTTSSISTTTTE